MTSKIHGFTVLTSGVALVLGLALTLPATAKAAPEYSSPVYQQNAH